MAARELLEEALKLKPEDRFVLVEGLLKSLDEPDRVLDDVWVEEAEKRLRAYREGRLDGVPMEDVFGRAQCGSSSPGMRSRNSMMPFGTMNSKRPDWAGTSGPRFERLHCGSSNTLRSGQFIGAM